MKKLIYLATPYSKYPHGREAAFGSACLMAAHLMEHYNVFCPIAHSHSVEVYGMNGDIKDGYWWLGQDFSILEKCDKLIVYKMQGWDESFGVSAEIAFANERGIPVEYVD